VPGPRTPGQRAPGDSTGQGLPPAFRPVRGERDNVLRQVCLNEGLQWRVERVAHAMTLSTPSEGGTPPHDGNLQAGRCLGDADEPPSHLIYNTKPS
jgi:hypothetical protein